MVEVAAEKNDKGRAGDPAAAARRRAMTLKLRQARQTLTTNSIDFTGQYASLARLFANSVAGATPAMALVALAVGAIACYWVPAPKVVSWGVLLAVSLAVRYGLAIAFLDLPEPEKASARLAAQIHRRRDLRRRRLGAAGRPAAAIARPQRPHLRAGRAAAGLGHDGDGRLGDPLRRRRRPAADGDRDRLRARADDARAGAA